MSPVNFHQPIVIEGNACFLSDAHLGTGNSELRETLLCQLLEQQQDQIQHLFLLGDMFDFWFEYRDVVPKGYCTLFSILKKLQQKGIKIYYFTGNHDMWVFDYLKEEIGLEMHSEPQYMEFDGKRLYIGHGDGLGHLDNKYDFLKKVFRSKFNQQLFRMLPSSLTFGIAHRWSDHSRTTHDPDDLRYLGDEREGIVIHCKQEMEKGHIDYCVFGHRHTAVRQAIKTSTEQSTYINVGNWIEARNYAVFENGEMQLENFSM